MAQKRSSSKKRAQGGGRSSNSEPRLQVFQQFGGCNFAESPRDFDLEKHDEEQSDLQMNYVTIQNNVEVADNKTLKTRRQSSNIVNAPKGKKFSGPSIMVGEELYLACTDGSIVYCTPNFGGTLQPSTSEVTIVDLTGKDPKHTWQSFAYVDDQLIGTTEEDMLWSGGIEEHLLSNAKKVPKPPKLRFEDIKPMGSLRISKTYDTEKDIVNRITIAVTHVNKFGPTELSEKLTFYANQTVENWHGGCFARISGTVPSGYDVIAVELYYTVANQNRMLIFGRTDDIVDNEWNYDWFGYLDQIYVYMQANTVPPEENLTEGVKASHMACIDSKMYFWGSKKHPYRLWIGGLPGSLFSIASGTGGGYADVEPGTGQEIRCVMKYKTQAGSSIVTMLCDSPNSSKEQRYNLVTDTAQLSNDKSMNSYEAEQVAGAVGCKSYRGAEACEDGLYSVSRYGLALTTLTMEYNTQIRTNYISDPIKPVFLDKRGTDLSHAVLRWCDGVLYLWLGDSDEKDPIIFCYDVGLKAWWTYTLEQDLGKVLDMIHIDYEGENEGIAFITPDKVVMIPTTEINQGIANDDKVEFLIQTGELATSQPQQNWMYLSQLEFRFDRFIGDMDIEVSCIDQFGRRIKTRKHISHANEQFDLAEHMRIDLRVQSYTIRMEGNANFRMSHFMARVYTMSSKQGMVWGFDDSQSFRKDGDIHPTFKDYNDIKRAIIP